MCVKVLFNSIMPPSYTVSDFPNHSSNFLLAQIDIYYRIHRVGLQPYPPLQLPLLAEHIMPAAN